MDALDAPATPPADDSSPGARGSRTDIFQKAGESRAVASGTINMVFSVASALVLWVFMIVGSGSDGLAYYGLGGSVNGIVCIVATGSSQAYVALVKEDLARGDKAAALRVASTYARLYFLWGLIVGGTIFGLAFVLPPEWPLKYVFLFGWPSMMLNLCVRFVMNFTLQVMNRYDVAGALSAAWGLLNVGMGIGFVVAQFDARYFVLVGVISSLVLLPVDVFYFRKVSPFRFRELLGTARLRAPGTKRILKYSFLTTLSNMESFQFVSNVLFFFTSISLTLISPALAIKGTALLTIINIYAQIKCALLYYAGPLNVELAEAYAKHEHDRIEDVVNHSARFSFLVGLGLVVGFMGVSGIILRYLHADFFLVEAGAAGAGTGDTAEFSEALFREAHWVLILMMVGQAGLGASCLFANALIGTENAATSAKVYTGVLVLAIVLAPVFTAGFQLGIVGFGVATLIVGTSAAFFMVRATKRALHLKYDLRLARLGFLLVVVFLVLFLFPYGHLTGLFFADLGIAIAIVVAIFIPSLSFLGIFEDEADWQVIRDLYSAFGMRRFAELAVTFSQRLYNLNPLNRARLKRKNIGKGGRPSEERAPAPASTPEAAGTGVQEGELAESARFAPESE